MSGTDALYGPSPMMSLIHDVQLELSEADLSFAAPLSISATLEEGLSNYLFFRTITVPYSNITQYKK